MKQLFACAIFALMISLLAGLLAFPQPGLSAPQATFTVNDSSDSSDLSAGDGVCDANGAHGVQCTLRAAIQEANALRGHDTILVGALTITPSTPLPALTDDSGATIKGNNVTTILDGNNLVTVGVNIESDNNNVQGLVIWNFTDYGVRVWWSSNNVIGTNGDGIDDSAERNVILHNGIGIFLMGGGNQVAGNYIGVFGTGTLASPNGTGIYVEGTLDPGCETVIGTNGDGIGDSSEGNLISGNSNNGVYIHNSCVTLAGNTIGLNASGTAALPNSRGVLVDEYAPDTLIGTNADGVSDTLERNIISGNSIAGIELGFGVSQVTIAGNFVGLNPTGSVAFSNDYGIYISDANQITIGTNDDGSNDDKEGNVISGNTQYGICIEGMNSSGNAIAGNLIGTNRNGETPIPNGTGIYVLSAPGNLIGTDGDGLSDSNERNLVSGNAYNGILIKNAEAAGNRISGNHIGLNASGDTALKNGAGDWGVGVFIDNAPNTLIGTDANGVADTSERNVISGNNVGGVYISGSQSQGTILAGNYIGTNPGGLVAIPNGIGFPDQAVMLDRTQNLRIGTNGDGINDASERNVISGNLGWGIRIYEGAGEYLVAGNFIGVNVNGNGALGNSQGGILLEHALDVTIGGTLPAMLNIIANNGAAGVTVDRSTNPSVDTTSIVRGNAIYANTGLGIDLGSDEVNANDAGDADTGPNELQNYPVLTVASSSVISTVIGGTLNSTPSKTFWIDLYASSVCDTSGYGEGQIYLGSHTLTTNASGIASFSTSLSTTVAAGYHITATATGVTNGSTSEFSHCISAVSTDFSIYLPMLRR